MTTFLALISFPVRFPLHLYMLVMDLLAEWMFNNYEQDRLQAEQAEKNGEEHDRNVVLTILDVLLLVPMFLAVVLDDLFTLIPLPGFSDTEWGVKQGLHWVF